MSVRSYKARHPLSFCVPLVLASSVPISVIAQEGAFEEALTLPTVMVTAEKREQSLQDVTASVSALDDVDLEDAGVNNANDLDARVPNLYIQDAATTSSFMSLRGIASQLRPGAPAGIGVYVDGVTRLDPLGTLMTNMDMLDVERVEVLRGPQGTLWGRNTEAGAINIVTRRPDNTLRATGQVTLGHENLLIAEAIGNAPLVDGKLFMSLAGIFTRRDGYTVNTFTGNNVDDVDEMLMRAKLRWLPSDALDIQLTVDKARVRDGTYDYSFAPEGDFSRAAPHKTVSNLDDQREYRDAYGVTLDLGYDLGAAQLTSITAFRKDKTENFGDGDFTQFDIADSLYNSEQKQWTQELRLASKEGSDRLEWLVGVFLFDATYKNRFDSTVGSDGPASGLPEGFPLTVGDETLKDKGQSVFGSLTYALTDRWKLTGGLRYEREEKSLSSVGLLFGQPVLFDGDANFYKLLPRISLAYARSPDMMAYVTISRGARSGGFNTPLITSMGNTFGTEVSTSYEIGLKSIWWGRRLRLNAAAFLMDIDDQQIGQTVPGSIYVITRNVGKSRNYGVELEVQGTVTRELDLIASAAYLNTEIKSYSDPVTGIDYAGKKAPLAPNYSYLLAAQYDRPIGNLLLSGRLELKGTGRVYFDSANHLSQDPYRLLNLRFGLRGDNWSVALWGKNLTDEDYARMALSDGAGNALVGYGAPRTYGITASYSFY